MVGISSVTSLITPYNDKQFKPVSLNPTLETKTSTNSNLISRYLENLSLMNKTVIRPTAVSETVTLTPATLKPTTPTPAVNTPAVQNVTNYKNDLKTMFKNNNAVILAMIPRTFNAKDINGDEKINISAGEKNSTFLSCIERLDEIKQNGFNTLHLLPIHPTGKEKAMGTAGSVYSPQDIINSDGKLAIDPTLIDKSDSRSPQQQFKAFIDACHAKGIKVMLDLPSCASYDLFKSEPELMAINRFGVEKTPQGWADIRMFQPWADETKRTLNPKLLEMHKQFVDNCIELGVDGIRADVARAKPTEFWDILIPYSHQKDKEFAWLGETYVYECASPQVNMPYDRPKDSLRAGFDTYYGQYHIFHEWENAKEFNDYIKHNLDLSKELPKGKSVIGSFSTHDDVSPMVHGGVDYCNLTTVLQSTIPMCNPYFVDGFQSGDYYQYAYGNTKQTETVTDSNVMTVHPYKLDIFNLSRMPQGKNPEIGNFLKKTLEMRNNFNNIITNGSYIELQKKDDKQDQIIAFARHLNGKTLLVLANKNVNKPVSATISIPTLKSGQNLNNLVPNYGEKCELQATDGELRVNLGKARALVFEINTPDIEKYSQGHVFNQNL